MRLTDVRYVIGISGYFQKDLKAVKQSTKYNSSTDHYNILPCTPGFKKVVQAGQTISVLLLLPNGGVAVGDCTDVIFAGAASRDPPFIAEEHLPFLTTTVRSWLLTCDMSHFRGNAEYVDGPWQELQNKRLHSAVRYGLSQALISATALIHHCTIAEIVSREWKTQISKHPVDILVSCHRGDSLQLDRMILKRVSMLPHASFLHLDDIGSQGERLLDYVQYVARRVQERGDPGYNPRLHFDVYGTLGDAFVDDDKLTMFLEQLAQVSQPYELFIESPVIESNKAAQVQRLGQLRRKLAERQIKVKLVADEWCNTLDDIREFAEAGAVDYVQIKTPDLGSIHNSIDAVVFCRENGVGCCLGGSANETDISARITAQIALATQPQFLLSKPGIGGDEGLMILTNEMLRALVLMRHE